ncbi:MAG: hypothetical protein MOGMAGMI_00410 [Candidatus Omnitrophica bacterium]|nr:hypothetical protein [Candidatus Omnitrophota bacterium]
MRSSPAERPGNSGFTLIELLLAAFLAVFAGAVSVAVLSQGSRVAGRIERLVLQEEMSFLVERLTADLANAATVPSAPFGAGDSSISFVSIDPGAASSERPDGVARLVRYWYDTATGAVWRAETPFLSEGTMNERKEELFRGLRGMRFEYDTSGVRVPPRVTLVLGIGGGRRASEEMRVDIRVLCGYAPA